MVANLDLDVVGYGPPPSAFGSFDMKIRNLASIWRNYQSAGAQSLIVSGLSFRQAEMVAASRPFQRLRRQCAF